MKKQIIILVMAFFAIGITNSYGQVIPRRVTCLTIDALHPIAGNPFTYQIDVPATPTGGTAWTGGLKYLWYVTQNQEFIKLVGGVPTLTPAADRQLASGTLLASTDGNYNDATKVSNSISLTWKSFTYVPSVPIFVVINVVGDNGTCNPANMKVFKIEPQNAFTLDIDNLTEAGAANTLPVYDVAGVLLTGGYGDNYTQCLSSIVSATYDPTGTAPHGIIYDYGQNVLIYEVVAANWTTSWRPSVQISGVNPQENIKVEWSKDKTFPAASSVTMAGAGNSAVITDVLGYTSLGATGVVTITAPSGNAGAAGESIFIRVTLDHTTAINAATKFEGLTDQTIVLAVDGITDIASAAPIGDIHTVAGLAAQTPSQDCPWVDGFVNDKATQTVKARPTVTASTMAAPGLAPIK